MKVNLITIYLLTFPILLSGILHMLVVRFDMLTYFKKPIHIKWFGENKTWRGILVMPLLSVLGVELAKWQETYAPNKINFSDQSSLLVGCSLGLAYVIFELPNSWIKRRLGIKPGELSLKHAWFFAILDQADSAIGCGLVYVYFLELSWPHYVILVLGGTIIHLIVNYLLYLLKIRRNPL